MIDLIKLRKKMKSKKPKFVRQEAYRRKRLSRSGWRTPKGMQSKMRKKMGSKRKLPSVGYSSPRAVRGLTREGLKPVLVKSINNLSKIKDEVVIISKSVGLRKRLQILGKIKELKLKVGNIKNIDDFIKQAKEKLAEKKANKIKVKKLKELAKKPKEKPKEKVESKEEKEKREKEEKRKILEKK